jgi:hypothetical protein
MSRRWSRYGVSLGQAADGSSVVVAEPGDAPFSAQSTPFSSAAASKGPVPFGDKSQRRPVWACPYREYTSIQWLQLYELLTASFHGIQMVLMLVFIYGYDRRKVVPLSIPYVTWPSRTDTDPHFGYHVQPDGSIDMALCLFGFFMLSFVFQFVTVSPPLWPSFVNNLLDRYITPARWLEYSISASLMAIVFALLNGISTTTFLYNIFIEFFLTMMLGLLQEVGMSVYKHMFWDVSAAAKPPGRRRLDWVILFLPHFLGWVSFLGVVSVFIVTFSLAVSHSPQAPPQWVYFLYSFQFVIMSSFAFVQIVEQALIYRSDDIVAARRRRFLAAYAPGETAETDARFAELLQSETEAAGGDPRRLRALARFRRVAEPAPIACRRYVVLAEFAYTTLSLAAKSVLCWVLFTNVLVEQKIKY